MLNSGRRASADQEIIARNPREQFALVRVSGHDGSHVVIGRFSWSSLKSGLAMLGIRGHGAMNSSDPERNRKTRAELDFTERLAFLGTETTVRRKTSVKRTTVVRE